jgi:hypothetical protein
MKDNGAVLFAITGKGSWHLFFFNLQIERIQNPALWRRYQAYKKSMDEKNGNVRNEKHLFHGTEASSLPQLNSNGFNRSYAGKNGKCWGLGIATQTSISIQ